LAKRRQKRPRIPSLAVAQRYRARTDDPGLDDLPEINDQHLLFVAHYVQHFNGARAARDAGYSHNTARSIAWTLLTRPDVQAHVAFAVKQLGTLHFDLHNQIVAELRDMLSADVSNFYDADGNVVDPKTLEEPERKLIEGIETEEHMVGEGDGALMIRTKKLKLASRLSIMDRLAKFTGLAVERTQALGKDGKPVDPSPTVINVHYTKGPENADRAGQQPVIQDKRARKKEGGDL